MELNTLTISIEHVKDTCRPGSPGGVTCSYLGATAGEFVCLKTSQSTKSLIDKRRAEGTIKAMGDNCAGWAHPALMVLGNKAIA